MAILQTTTIVTSGAGPVKVPGSSPLGAETVTDSILPNSHLCFYI